MSSYSTALWKVSGHEVEDCGTGSLGSGHPRATLSRGAPPRDHSGDDRSPEGAKYPRAFCPTPPTLLEAPASASGVIRHDEVPLLAPYGTSYGLFDEWICDYECVLVSDVYRLADYVGDSVWVSGPLRSVIGGMPVMDLTHLELLKMKWMR